MRLQRYAPATKGTAEAKYKGDKQKLNEEVMKFYREKKVNPAASCLPILPQIPIFIALFFVLREFDEGCHRSSVSRTPTCDFRTDRARYHGEAP